ncbi:MAG TPA: ABC transporter ATP-binding protein [Candidatus Dormibacteraeota bacterium]|nr:ABC transporter ATP-binding protein [Candidatus Dormibacteraeota bacterium]
MSVVVQLDHVGKRYGSVVALDDVSLTIESGEVVALLGPNGAGKTTAISLMLGLRRPTSGRARLLGLSPTDVDARSRCGVMLQESGVPELLTVRELVRLFSTFYPRHLPSAEVLRMAGLEEQAGTRVDRLSGGQRQRLFFALAVTGDPEVLFLDEPTVGMDVEGRRAFIVALRERARRGTTIVLTTHYLEEADQLADRVVVIDRGAVIADDSPAAIKTRVAGKRVELRFDSDVGEELFAGLPVTGLRVDGSSATMLSPHPAVVLRRVLNARDDIADVDVSGADLEDAFIHLTREGGSDGAGDG